MGRPTPSYAPDLLAAKLMAMVQRSFDDLIDREHQPPKTPQHDRRERREAFCALAESFSADDARSRTLVDTLVRNAYKTSGFKREPFKACTCFQCSQADRSSLRRQNAVSSRQTRDLQREYEALIDNQRERIAARYRDSHPPQPGPSSSSAVFDPLHPPSHPLSSSSSSRLSGLPTPSADNTLAALLSRHISRAGSRVGSSGGGLDGLPAASSVPWGESEEDDGEEDDSEDGSSVWETEFTGVHAPLPPMADVDVAERVRRQERDTTPYEGVEWGSLSSRANVPSAAADRSDGWIAVGGRGPSGGDNHRLESGTSTFRDSYTFSPITRATSELPSVGGSPSARPSSLPLPVDPDASSLYALDDDVAAHGAAPGSNDAAAGSHRANHRREAEEQVWSAEPERRRTPAGAGGGGSAGYSGA